MVDADTILYIIWSIIKILVIPAIIAYTVIDVSKYLSPIESVVFVILVMPTAISFYAVAALGD